MMDEKKSEKKKNIGVVNKDKKKAHNSDLKYLEENEVKKENVITKKIYKILEKKNYKTISDKDIELFYQKNEVNIEDVLNYKLKPIIKFDYFKEKNKLKIFNKFETPTPVQSCAWPYLFCDRDMIAISETGSGKTFAFGYPCIISLLRTEQSHISKLIISPTRELSIQINESLNNMIPNDAIKCGVIYGGVPKKTQLATLKNTNILVTTPGRLIDFLDEGLVDILRVDFLVLDEADRMLEKGFKDDIKKIVGFIKFKPRQTVLFSATWPQEVQKFAFTLLNEPVTIKIGSVDKLKANKNISQIVEIVSEFDKNTLLLKTLRNYVNKHGLKEKILIFALYKKEAVRLLSFLQKNKFKSCAIHGDLSQEGRIFSLNSFKSGKSSILVATDVASRGLDIPNVNLVINYTFPLTIEDYVHRIGRTGRASSLGTSHTFFTNNEKHLSGQLINLLKETNQTIPDDLIKFGTHVKKKKHSVYGDFYKEIEMNCVPKKIKFEY